MIGVALKFFVIPGHVFRVLKFLEDLRFFFRPPFLHFQGAVVQEFTYDQNGTRSNCWSGIRTKISVRIVQLHLFQRNLQGLGHNFAQGGLRSLADLCAGNENLHAVIPVFFQQNPGFDQILFIAACKAAAVKEDRAADTSQASVVHRK